MNKLIRSIFLLLAVPLLAQTAPPRPKVPDAATLASPTSQIKAWYQYAVYQENQAAMLAQQLEHVRQTIGTIQQENNILRAMNDKLTQIEDMKRQLASTVSKSLFVEAEAARALSDMQRMQLQGKVEKYEAILKNLGVNP